MGRIQLVLEIFHPTFHVSGASMQLLLIGHRGLFDFGLLGCLSLLHLANELLFLEGQFFSFKFEQLELLLVLSCKVSELGFSFLEGHCLELVLIVDLHDLFDVLLLP